MAKGNLIGFVDSDKSTSPEEFYKLYLNIKDCDGIIASRRIKGASVIPKRSFSKRISSLGFSLVVKFLFRFGYEDTQCGAKLFKKNVAKYFVKNLKEVGWIFDIDLLNLCKKKKYLIKEFPILWVDDEGSHIGNLDGIKSVLNVIRYKFIS